MEKELKAYLAKKEARKTELTTKSAASTDVVELRSINTELETLNTEITELRGMIDALPAKTDPAPATETPLFSVEARGVPVPGQLKPLGTYQMASANTQPDATQENRTDKFGTVEYRTAFKNYIQRNVPIAAEYRSDEYTDAAAAAAVIPTTIVNEVIKTLKQYGNLYARVRKLNVKGGVKIPISSVAPTATWITESADSERKKIDLSTSITFSYYGLECKIASSLLAEETTLDIFESTVIELLTEAMVKALDIGIISGDGIGEMTGITINSTIAAAAVTLSSADFQDWSAWKKKVFAKLGIRYKANAAFIMANGTFEGYIDGMTDANGQPIGRVNYGITNGAQERFGGKEVILVEDDVVANYDDASTGTVVGIFGDLSKYAINTNMQMTMYRYLDHDTNQWIDKAILIADGKVLDPAAFVVIKKGA
jgi:HK97 family phage major capsid protein